VKNIFKISIISILFFTATPLYAKGVYVLCYHAFLEKKDPYSFTNAQFKDQLERLKNNGFKFVTFEDIINDRISGNKNILISIDDGNKSVYQAYFEIMKPMGIKPLLGIYPAIISKTDYAMTWEQLQELSNDGCYIAAHGYHHMYLSEKYYQSDQAGFKKEIYLSKKVLEEKLNRKIETMVYPFGTYSDIAISELKNAGYKYGMTIVAKMEAIPINDHFLINRYLMTKPAEKDIIARISKQANSVQISSNANDVEEKKVMVNGTPDSKEVMVSAIPDNKKVMVNGTPDSKEVIVSVIPDNPDRIDRNDRIERIEKKSIIYYPERMKQIILEDAFISNPDPKEIKTTNNNLNTTFKPFVYKSETPPQQKKSKKEVIEKKNRKKKRV
jgi:peptidoglycan/xylan/chitin deacetylase (PgdA/CDA1 family)